MATSMDTIRSDRLHRRLINVELLMVKTLHGFSFRAGAGARARAREESAADSESLARDVKDRVHAPGVVLEKVLHGLGSLEEDELHAPALGLILQLIGDREAPIHAGSKDQDLAVPGDFLARGEGSVPILFALSPRRALVSLADLAAIQDQISR